jgi:toxin YhaV
MGVLIRNGWEIYFHRQLFGEQWRQLREQVKQLKAELPEPDYLGHPDVKLLAAVMVGIKEKIVLDPQVYYIVKDTNKNITLFLSS